MEKPSTTSRVVLSGPMVEIDGDDMARVIHHLVKEQLISPHVDLTALQYFDCSLENRIATSDKVLDDAIAALSEAGVGIKCSTRTATQEEPLECKGVALASASIRIWGVLGGTEFRQPIVIRAIPRLVKSWKAPIVIACCAHGERTNARQVAVSSAGLMQMRFTPTDGSPVVTQELYSYPGAGIAMGSFNTVAWVTEFARCVFRYGLERGLPVLLSTKCTVLTHYDGLYVDTFQKIYDAEFRSEYEGRGLTYSHHLIDDMVALCLRSEGNFVWACKSHDGMNASSLIGQGFGSVGLMTSTLLSCEGKVCLTSTTHGTVPRHYKAYRAGRQPSTNPLPTIFSWTNALRRRGTVDGSAELVKFANDVEKAAVSTVEAHTMTQDLAQTVGSIQLSAFNTVTMKNYVTTARFVEMVAARLAVLRSAPAGSC
eukprot:RCo004576